ncbi:MAG TPA: NADH-quinone oxidoreductase subunit M [Gaiellales bacterium]|nr:NADH-quinone oxidoreductase subunit M [Gaiellales bacterium]
MTTLLIFVPLAAAVVVGLLPLNRRASEGLALLAALGVAALAAVSLLRFQLHGGIQFAQDVRWIPGFGAVPPVRFHVGMTGLSLFMVLLTAVGIASAVAAAIWAGRERPRLYLALLLVLEAALMLLFCARDLVVFYVGWESMMIPLYVLMAFWGGPLRRLATIRFVVYTLAGSLLMLVAVAVLGVSAHTFEISALAAHPHESIWLFLAFSAAFCIKAPLFPLHGWLPMAYRSSTAEVTGLLSGVISKAGAYGLITFSVGLFPHTAHDWRWLMLGLGLAGLLYGSLVAFRVGDARGVIAYSSVGQMNLIVIGIFSLNVDGLTGAEFQMVNHGLISLAAFLLVGLVELRSGTDLFARLGGLANRRPRLSTVFLVAALFALAVPGSSTFVSELYILLGAFRQQPVLGAAAASGILLAAMYMLRWYSALAHGGNGDDVADDTPDLRSVELAIALPLILLLLAMTAYPWGVMQRIVA